MYMYINVYTCIYMYMYRYVCSCTHVTHTTGTATMQARKLVKLKHPRVIKVSKLKSIKVKLK